MFSDVLKRIPLLDPKVGEMNERMLSAVNEGDLAALNFALNEGARPNYEYQRAMHLALRMGDCSALNVLYEFGGRFLSPSWISAPDEAENNLLNSVESAAENGFTNTIELAAEKEAQINEEKLLRHALHVASKGNQIEAVTRLLESGAKFGEISLSLLRPAIQSNNRDLLKLILSNSTQRSEAFCSAALEYILEGQRYEIADLFIDYGVRVEAENYQVFVQLAGKGDTVGLKFLLSHGVKLPEGVAGRMLGEASRSGHEETVKFLLSTQKPWSASTLEAQIAFYPNEKMMLGLLAAGLDPNSRDGDFILHASATGMISAIRAFAKAGANLSVRLHTGRTPIGEAVQYDLPATVKILFENGAEIPDRFFYNDCSEDVARLPGQQRFPILLSRIAACKKATNPVAALEDLLQFKADFTKNGALLPDTPWNKQPIVRIAVNAAFVGSVTSLESWANAWVQTRTVFRNDIARVENTPGLSWKKYAEELARNLEDITGFVDVVSEVSDVIILPLLQPMLGAIPHMEEISKKIASRLIVKDKSSLDFASLDRKWHKPGNKIPEELIPQRERGAWRPLFEAIKLDDDISVVAISEVHELRREGGLMRHCVASYAPNCRDGVCQIVSIRKDNEPIATLELRKTVKSEGVITGPNNAHWRVAQFKAIGNSPPGHLASEALSRFLSLVQAGSVKINQVEAVSKGESTDSWLMSRCGYEPKDASMIIPKIIQHYAERVFVERGNGNGKVFLIDPALSYSELKSFVRHHADELSGQNQSRGLLSRMYDFLSSQWGAPVSWLFRTN